VKNSLKLALKHTTYKVKYPNSRITFSANVGSNTILAENINIGKNTSISNSILREGVLIHEECGVHNTCLDEHIIVNSHCCLSDVTVGRFSYLATDSHLQSTRVGSFCSIGPSLICGYGEHPTDFVSTSPVFFSTRKQCGVTFAKENYFEELREVIIGHDVWIGARVFIKNGVKIGNGAIVAAGAVVVKDVPDYAIVGGIPAKIIRFRFSEGTIQDLLSLKWWDWREEDLAKAQKYLCTSDLQSFIEWARSEA